MFKRKVVSKSGKKTYKKRRYSKGRVMSRSVVQNVVKQELTRNLELKFKRTTGNSTFGTAPGIMMVQLNNITQGTQDAGQRVGDRLKYKAVTARFALSNGHTSYLIPDVNYVRVIFFTWKPMLTGSVPATTDILESATTISPLRHDYRQMYVIHKDYTVRNVVLYDPLQAWFTSFRVPENISESQYAAASATNSTNTLFMMVLPFQSGAGVFTYLEYDVNVTYTDA